MLFAVKNADIGALDSLLVFVIGMLIIFLALTIIIFVVLAYVGVFKLADKTKKKPAVVPESETEGEPVAASADDAELVAAIMTAVTAVMASESKSGEVAPFRVKSIVRK